MAFKTFSHFGDIIIEICNSQIVNANVLNVVMPKYNIENYVNTSKTLF